MNPNKLIVAVAQIAPVWLDRSATIEKVVSAIDEAASRGAAIVAFGGEVLVPGYIFWIERTGGATFGDPDQKDMHRHYVQQAVCIENGDLDPVVRAAERHGIAVIIGILERPPDRGGHSLYASAVHISAQGKILSVHRKLVPTYEERLSWGIGDGHGLVTHPVGVFTVGVLNCWENWMPLARAAMYAQGEDLHIALWPGGDHLTKDITRFIALEGRSYVISAGAPLRPSDIPSDTPMRERIVEGVGDWFANGGSCIAAPDGSWVIEPQAGVEGVFVATLDHARVLEERHNFDPSGHYSRPDVFALKVDRRRQHLVHFSGVPQAL